MIRTTTPKPLSLMDRDELLAHITMRADDRSIYEAQIRSLCESHGDAMEARIELDILRQKACNRVADLESQVERLTNELAMERQHASNTHAVANELNEARVKLEQDNATLRASIDILRKANTTAMETLLTHVPPATPTSPPTPNNATDAKGTKP